MTLTLSYGPLSSRPAPGNYRIEGPAHRVFVHDVPQRVRVVFAGETIFDTTAAKLLHESNLLPVYYLPLADARQDLLTPTDHTTHCPFKGDAGYWDIRVGDRVAEQAVWSYPEPVEGMEVLAGHAAFYLDAVDAVYEEDDEVVGHPRDPFHRVDIHPSSRHVRVTVDGKVLADTDRPLGVFETGLPARWYLPREDVATDRLVASDTRTTCPYKGVAGYFSLPDGPDDVAWTYPSPFSDGAGLDGHLCFHGEGVVTKVDGEVVA